MEKKTSCRSCCKKKATETPAVDKYSGVEVDVADNEKISAEAVQQMTAELNDNPRDN